MSEKTYYYWDTSQKEVGPLSLDMLAKLRLAGVLEDVTMVREADSADWQSLDTLILVSASTPSNAAQPLEEASQEAIRVLNNNSFLRWVRVTLFALAAMTFLFPFLSYKGNLRSFTFSGKDFVTGTEIRIRDDWNGEVLRLPVPASKWLIASLVLCGVSLFLSWLRPPWIALWTAGSGLVSFALLLYAKTARGMEMMKETGGGIWVTAEFGLVCCCVFLLLGVAASAWQFKRGNSVSN